MRVQELLKGNVVAVRSDASIQEVARKMAEEDIGFLPVVDASGKAIGTLTDRDIVVRLIAKGGDATDLFSELDTLVGAVQAGDDAAIGVGIAALSRAFDRTVRAQSQVGTDERSTSDGQGELVSLRLAGVSRLSTLDARQLATTRCPFLPENTK